MHILIARRISKYYLIKLAAKLSLRDLLYVSRTLFIIQQNPHIHSITASSAREQFFFLLLKISCKYEINSYNLKKSESESKYIASK